jgi:predicted nucleic acid-binding protein
MTGVLDANGIIGLAKSGGCFAFVGNLFDQVLVPPAVVAEVQDEVSVPELQSALASWLVEATPTLESTLQVEDVHPEADRQVLALALDSSPSTIITGDRGVARRAAQLGISTIDAPRIDGVLTEVRLVNEARPFLDAMRAQGFGIPDHQYDDILRSLGE